MPSPKWTYKVVTYQVSTLSRALDTNWGMAIWASDPCLSVLGYVTYPDFPNVEKIIRSPFKNYSKSKVTSDTQELAIYLNSPYLLVQVKGMPLSLAKSDGPVVKRQKLSKSNATKKAPQESRIFTPFRVCY